MKLFVPLLFFTLCFSVNAQDGPPEFKKPQTKAVKVSNAPVTKSEAKKVFDKLWNALSEGLAIKGPNPVKFSDAKGNVTRNEVVVAIHSIISATEASYKRSPRKLVFDRKRLRKDFDQAKHLKLIEEGFISPYGPLTTGKIDQLTTKQFGESVGQVLVRVADLCHLPSRKFSPFLKSQDR
jgi:hypothetical protein